jgi:hypothetical protein
MGHGAPCPYEAAWILVFSKNCESIVCHNFTELLKHMNVYKHAAVSFAVSALLHLAFKKIQMSLACFLTGVLLDVDHVLDYYLNHELWEKFRYLRHPRELIKFLSNGYYKSKPTDKVYKPLHSIELLIPISLLYIFRIWNEMATGMLIGFATHLIMDVVPMGHIGTASMIYKIKNGFPRGGDIIKQRLSRIGVDVGKCQQCGAQGELIYHKPCSWYAGFTKRGLRKMMVLCKECHDQMHNEGK